MFQNITCICDGYTIGEVMWGIKNVLHEFIHEEGCKITPEYCLPVSKGLQEALRYYLVNIPPKVVIILLLQFQVFIIATIIV